MISFGNIRLCADIPESARTWRNNPIIFKYCRQHSLISQAEQELWLDKLKYDKTIKMFSVEAPIVLEGSTYWREVGVCGLTSINLINGNAEFSLYIAQEYQRKGYGRPALIALLGHGFLNWRLERIWGEVFDFNQRAFGMFKDIGFQVEGELRNTYFKEGKYINSYIISMLSDEFDYQKNNQDIG